MSTLSIIIVNWNSGKQLSDCLQSIIQTSKNNFLLKKVIVVDNNSKDNSLENIKGLNLPLQIINNNENIGFAAACNQGAYKAESDYLLFLNPDTVLFDNSLAKPIEFMEKKENQDIGISGIQLIDEQKDIHKSCTRFPHSKDFIISSLGLNNLFSKKFNNHFMKEWGHDNNRYVDHVIGAFYLIRNDLFTKANGFDERFFVYLEDLDLSLRINNLGYSCYFISDVQAYHKGGGTSEQVKALRLFYSLRSRLQYSYKHFSVLKANIVLLITVILEFFTRSIFNLFINRSFKSFKETIKAYTFLIKEVPSIIKEVKVNKRQ